MTINSEKLPPLPGIASGDDYSGQVQALRKALMQETDGDYQRFIGTLAPRYWRTWLDIALGYLFLALVVYLVGVPSSMPAQLVAILAGAIAIGYGVAHLQLFLHEASHYNLAPSRAINDGIADTLIAWLIGSTLARYRPVHFAHHRLLGTTADSENSYFNALSLRFMVETLTGIHALRIQRNRDRRVDRQAADTDKKDRTLPMSRWPMLRGIVLHGAVCAGAYMLSGWVGPIAWVLGVGTFSPLFGALRQLLEHRSTTADPEQDYAEKDHGAVSRMFGVGPLASTFGGAGFNRHLLHHWEPKVSYTRLADLERYLDDTVAGRIIEARRCTYLATAAALWRAAQRGPARV